MAASKRTDTRDRRRARGPVLLEPTADRIAVIAAVAISSLLVFPPSRDIFTLGRATALILVALALLVWWGASVASGIAVRWPRTRAAVVAAVVVALLAVAVLTARDWRQAMFGPTFRSNGFAMYAACAVIFLAALRLRRTDWERVALWWLGIGGVVIAYGLLQTAGADPFTWETDLRQVFSTFGQTNFASAYLGIALPVIAYVALSSERDVRVRAAAGAVFVGGVAFLFGTKSFQGLPAAAIGLTPLALHHVRRRFDLSVGRMAAGATGAIVLVLLVVVAVGPLRGWVRDELDSGFDERRLLWSTAVDMAADAPVIGTGIASYGEQFSEHRPAEHSRRFGYLVADAPHSVPLEMLVNGGVLLLGAWLAFAVAVGISFVQGVRRGGGPLLLAIGGAWLAYQVQAAVSFDVPSTAVLHWIVAGGVLALAAATRPEPAEVTIGRARSQQRTPGWEALAAGGVIALVVAFFASIPLRADIAADSAGKTVKRDLVAGLDDLQDVAESASWDGSYWADVATGEQVAGRNDRAIAAAERAIENDPGAISYVVGLAQLLHNVGRDDDAAEWYQEAIERDPRNVAVYGAAAQLAIAVGKPDDAVTLFEKTTEIDPDCASCWQGLADAYEAAGETADARAASERADELSG